MNATSQASEAAAVRATHLDLSSAEDRVLVAAFLGWLGEVRINKIGRYGVALCVTAVFASLIVNLMQEHSRFEYQVFAPTWQKHGPEIRAIWDDHMPNVDRRDLSGFSHPQQHAQYANVARQLAAKLRMLRGDVATGGTRRIIYVDVNNFSEAPVVPIGLDYIANRNFHSIFLALYTGQEGVNVNPVVMVDPSRKPISPYLMSGLAYEGKPREYSALMDLGSSGRLVYRDTAHIVPVIVRITGESAYDILVTTPEEEAGARSLLQAQQIPFDYVRI